MIVLTVSLVIVVLLTACGSGNNSQMPTQASHGKLLLDKAHGDHGSAWGKAECDNCHAIKVIHKNASKIIQQLSSDKGYTACAGCHGNNGSEAERHCITCHNPKDLPTAPLSDGSRVHHFGANKLRQDTLAVEVLTDKALTDKECIICHVSSDMNGKFELNADLTHFDRQSYENEAQFCQSCHNRIHQQLDFPITDKAFDDPLIAIEDDYQYFDYHGFRNGNDQGTYHGLREGYNYPQLLDCSDCHAMHGTQNKQLIIDRSDKGVKKLPKTIRQKPYAIYTDGSNGTVAGDYGQLCVMCHQMQVLNDKGGQNAGNGLKGVHEVNSDCRDCHTHGEATQIGL